MRKEENSVKRFLRLLMALCLLCAVIIGARAAQTGTIDITVKYQDEPVDGGKLKT
jgi:hypothetical protein